MDALMRRLHDALATQMLQTRWGMEPTVWLSPLMENAKVPIGCVVRLAFGFTFHSYLLISIASKMHAMMTAPSAMPNSAT